MENDNTNQDDLQDQPPNYNYPQDSLDKLKKAIDKLSAKDKKKAAKKVSTSPKVVKSMSERYKDAWNEIYGKTIGWKQKVIDNCVKVGKMDDRVFTDFAQQVISAAELGDSSGD